MQVLPGQWATVTTSIFIGGRCWFCLPFAALQARKDLREFRVKKNMPWNRQDSSEDDIYGFLCLSLWPAGARQASSFHTSAHRDRSWSQARRTVWWLEFSQAVDFALSSTSLSRWLSGTFCKLKSDRTFSGRLVQTKTKTKHTRHEYRDSDYHNFFWVNNVRSVLLGPSVDQITSEGVRIKINQI